MRWRLDDLITFRAVAEGGGVTAAARTLDQPKSTVSKGLARLEQDLGLRLIERSSRRVRITPEGEALLEQAQLILEQAEQADALMSGLRAEPSGRVRLSVPAAFCREILAPRLLEFRSRYPSLALELLITTVQPDVVGGECDMAVVVGQQPDSGLAQQTLLGGRILWVASPAYCARSGLDAAGSEDASHIQICETRYANTPLELQIDGHRRELVLPPAVMRVNDPLSVREAVISGMGVSFLPERYCAAEIGRGDLVEVWRHVAFGQTASRLAVVYPTRRLLSPRYRAVLDFLTMICREHAPGRTG